MPPVAFQGATAPMPTPGALVAGNGLLLLPLLLTALIRLPRVEHGAFPWLEAVGSIGLGALASLWWLLCLVALFRTAPRWWVAAGVFGWNSLVAAALWRWSVAAARRVRRERERRRSAAG